MNDGGSAFPMLSFTENGGVGQVCECGMSLRDWFAGMVISPMLVQAYGTTPDILASRAYEIADAMIVESTKKEEPCQTKT